MWQLLLQKVQLSGKQGVAQITMDLMEIHTFEVTVPLEKLL